MATIDNKTEATISSEALSLLSCFCDGFDELVWRLAEGICRERMGGGEQPEIGAQDIIAAGNRLAAILKSSPDLDAGAKAAVDVMLACVERKAAARKR